MISRLAALILVCLSTACALQPQAITHLQLRSLATAPGTSDAPVLVIDAVSLPDYLLRDELMVRLGDHRLRYDPAFRWAEPLDLGIQRVLGETLESRLDTRRVVRFPAMPRGTADWRLNVRILAFEAAEDRVVLRAEGIWTAAATPQQTAAAVVFEDTLDLPAEPDAADIARSMSELLNDFGDALADALEATAIP